MLGTVKQLRPVDAGSRGNPQVVVPHIDRHWSLLSQVDSALVSSADGTRVAWYQRDPERFRALLKRTSVLHARLSREWPELSRRYRAAMAEIASAGRGAPPSTPRTPAAPERSGAAPETSRDDGRAGPRGRRAAGAGRRRRPAADPARQVPAAAAGAAGAQGPLQGLAARPGWSYVRPAVHFGVYFYVIGVFLGMDGRIESFPIYLFAGMVLINLFTETLHSTTRSVTGNAALVRKVFLPRELFPAASVLVSLVHFLPGFAILLGGAVATGWRPAPQELGAALLGFTIIVVLGFGLGLLCAAVNVFFRDLEQVVDISMIVITWSVPMIYPWTHVREHAPGWVLDVYLANPLVSAVSLFQRAFWFPGTGGDFAFPPHLYLSAAPRWR